MIILAIAATLVAGPPTQGSLPCPGPLPKGVLVCAYSTEPMGIILSPFADQRLVQFNQTSLMLPYPPCGTPEAAKAAACVQWEVDPRMAPRRIEDGLRSLTLPRGQNDEK